MVLLGAFLENLIKFVVFGVIVVAGVVLGKRIKDHKAKNL